MISKILRLLNTVKYLKFIQIYYRIFYFLRAKIRKITGFEYKLSKQSNALKLTLQDSIKGISSFNGFEFEILNLKHDFKGDIDWNFSDFGKLWTYNFNYFEFLDKKDDIWTIYDFIEKLPLVKDGLESFPISLRGINWIKFLTKHYINDKKIDDSLYAQYYILLENLEYHLLGNHLLENGFSLIFGGYYFKDTALKESGEKILYKELDEQILADGAHFELSPMYHQLMLFRLLDVINLVQNNSDNDKFLKFLREKAVLMLGYLKAITYKNGDIPMLNDSTSGVAPMSNELFLYAKNLGFDEIKPCELTSGYKKIDKGRYECILDITDVRASYIAGHTHADTFGFEIYIDSKPFIVDCGISTYENNTRRTYEKSTISHNTVEINSHSSSEVWGSFRLADRARVVDSKIGDDFISATHNGYKKFGVLHTRSWEFTEQKIVIKDSLSKSIKAISRLHFHPNVAKDEIGKFVDLKDKDCQIKEYEYALGYNKLQSAFVLEIYFTKELEVEIAV
ncbi:alginate lyase family protein [Campylobacter sp. RM12920]|uniref:Alginate lyase family protein n=1 Tax=Campylobacter californiensis TaxID=1032243 RepID=A0ABD4JF93_9BACT|nr:alginate lyase family protein [Campylobacter sp. RM12919]MBE2987451.1 alginate lyase family protein [Campylobacter sp. RM12920]